MIVLEQMARKRLERRLGFVARWEEVHASARAAYIEDMRHTVKELREILVGEPEPSGDGLREFLVAALDLVLEESKEEKSK